MLDHESGLAAGAVRARRARSRGIHGRTPIEAIATRGYGHLALRAAEIEPLFEQAVSAGAAPVVPPSPSPEPGVRFAFLRDPEGNLVELVELEPEPAGGRLAGKVALITGTAGGQGAAAARLFAAEGARAFGCDLDAERAEAVAGEVRAAGGEMHSTAPVDLGDPGAAKAWVDEAAARAGGLDIVYNNASAPWVGPFAEMSWENWRFTLHNELDLIFTVTKAAWPHLIARGGGAIVNTASVSAHRGAQFIEQAAHGAAKGGVLALTRHLAASGAPHGIRANSISPGLIVTPQIAPFLDEPGHPVHEMAGTHPLGRLGEPDDVARVALFLASDDAAYLNAVDIVVDGGQSLIS